MRTIAQQFEQGGWAMFPILLFLVCAIGIIIERSIYLYQSTIDRSIFLSTMQKCILAGDISRSIKLCAAAKAPLARIVQAGLIKVNRPDEEIHAAMDEEALKELPRLEQRTHLLELFSNLAMLSGLFGTVTGLITAFAAVANADPSSKATMLAKGISEAMNCTAFGLFSAIIALLGYSFLNNKTQKLLDDINAASVQIANLITSNRTRLDIQEGVVNEQSV